MKQRLIMGAIGLVLGAAGWLTAAFAGHFWQDHQLVDQIRENSLRQLQQLQQQAPPPR